METALGIPLAVLTAPALLLTAVWLVMSGRLIPRKTYEDLLRDRDDWREAHRISEAERVQQSQQISALLEVGHTVNEIMNALPHPHERSDDS